MRYNRQETLEILDEYSPARNVYGPEKWIDFCGFLMPLNHFHAVLQASDTQDFFLFQGKSGLAFRIGNLKIYFSQRNAERGKQEVVDYLDRKELARIKRFLKFAQEKGSDNKDYCETIKFENGVFVLLTRRNLIYGKTSIDKEIILSKSIFKRVKKGQGRVPIYKTDIINAIFPNFWEKVEEVRKKNVHTLHVRIPDAWKGIATIDFEKKTISKKDEKNGCEDTYKDSAQSPFCRGKFGLNLDQLPLRGEIDLLVSEQGPFLLETKEFTLMCTPVNVGSGPWDLAQAKPVKFIRPNDLILLDNRLFEKKTEYFFLFSPEQKKRNGSIFKKVMPEKTDLNFFYLDGRPYDIFSGLPFDFDQDDLSSLRRFFLKNWGKSPKYREINNVV